MSNWEEDKQSAIIYEFSEIGHKQIKQTATGYVINAIKKLLITGKINPGDKIPSETELAHSLGVSRGSIREAMKILAANGIVSVKRGDGTYVEDGSSNAILDPLLFKLILGRNNYKELVELREMLEIGIINLAVQNATEGDIENLKERHEYLKEKVDKGEYEGDVIIECEKQFHKAMSEATHNPLVKMVYDYIMDIFIYRLTDAEPKYDVGKKALISHKPIIDGIAERDFDKAAEAVRYSIEVWKKQSFLREE